MSRYERFAMILDPEAGELGLAALGLLARGIDPLYASDVDEALLGVREDRRVGALVLPGTLPPAQLEAALARVAPRLRGGTAAVVVVAPPRDRAALRALCDRGVRWVVRPPYQGAELRFAVAAAMAAEDEMEARSGLRVPTALAAAVRCREAPCEGRVLNLSVGGAYVALSEPPAVGCGVRVTLPVGDRVLDLGAQVVHRLPAAVPGRAESKPGVGVAFASLTDTQRRLLECFIRARVDSFRL